MSMIYIDGFDAYATADIPQRWVNSGSFSGFTVASSSGRNGTGALSLANTNRQYLFRSLGASYTSGLFVGCAFSLSALPASAFTPILSAQDVSNDPTTYGLVIGVDAAGNLIVSRYAGVSTQIGSYAAGIIANTFYYLEVKFAVNASLGANTFQVYLNGLLVLTIATSTNALPISGFTINLIGLGGRPQPGTTTTTTLWDDVYILNSSGSINNTFLGDVRVESIRPSAAGNTTQWTPNTGANYAAVDDTALDGDTTYVSSSTFAQKDTYTMGNLSSAPVSVKAVQVNMTGRKDDAGSRAVASVIRSGGADYDHVSLNPFYLADSYTTKSDIWELDPNGNIAWTGAAVDNMEAGITLAT